MRAKNLFAFALTAILTLTASAIGSAKELVNDHLKLVIPPKYDNVLQSEVLTGTTNGLMFTVSEKASLEAAKKEAAKKLNYDAVKGAGWLFGIGKIDEATLRDWVCKDMSGREIFAKDARGNYYVFYHPTDVRYMRENSEQMRRDQRDWERLNAWAWQDVRKDFVKNNPGLTPASYDNSDIGIHLAQILYQPGTDYTLSITEHGVLSPGYVAAEPYAAKLLINAAYNSVNGQEAPDGEYVVLNFPAEKTRFDFFLSPERENYVRVVREGGGEYLYQGVFADKNLNATKIMQAWYQAIVDDREMQKLGVTPDSLCGKWAEKIAGRGNITITKGQEAGTYDVKIYWADNYAEGGAWSMTAKPIGCNALGYKNCRHVHLTFTSEGVQHEKVLYENGTGTFNLNSVNEIMWQDDQDHVADNAVFVNVN